MARTKTKDAARLERLIAAGRQVHVIGIVWSLGVLGAFQFFTLRQWKKPSADVVGTWGASGFTILFGIGLVVYGTIGIARARATSETPIDALTKARLPMLLRMAGAVMLPFAALPASMAVGTWTPFAVTAPIAVVLLLAFMPRASQFR